MKNNEYYIIYTTKNQYKKITGPFTKLDNAVSFMRAYQVPTVKQVAVVRDRHYVEKVWDNPIYKKGV